MLRANLLEGCDFFSRHTGHQRQFQRPYVSLGYHYLVFLNRVHQCLLGDDCVTKLVPVTHTTKRLNWAAFLVVLRMLR
jgi:hypothetical protein